VLRIANYAHHQLIVYNAQLAIDCLVDFVIHAMITDVLNVLNLYLSVLNVLLVINLYQEYVTLVSLLAALNVLFRNQLVLYVSKDINYLVQIV